MGITAAGGVTTPGVKERGGDDEIGEVEALPADKAKLYRAVAARINIISQDRDDIQFATKESCRGMPKPHIGRVGAVAAVGKVHGRAPSCGVPAPVAAVAQNRGGLDGLGPCRVPAEPQVYQRRRNDGRAALRAELELDADHGGDV